MLRNLAGGVVPGLELLGFSVVNFVQVVGRRTENVGGA